MEQAVGVIHADATAAHGFRYFSAALVGAEHDPPCLDNVTRLTLPGGQYARHRVQGPGDLIAPAFRAIVDEWMPRSGFELDDRPLLEFYGDQYWLQRSADAPGTDIYVPLRVRSKGSARCAAGSF